MSTGKRRLDSNDRVVLSIVIAIVIYCDVAMIFNLSELPVKLPVERFTAYYNTMFRVFTEWSDHASSFVVRIEVRPRNGDTSESEWREFHVHELFPMPRGESFVRIANLCQRDADKFARQLRDIYQRRNPEFIIYRVRFYHADWPTSTDGFLARYHERELKLLAEN